MPKLKTTFMSLAILFLAAPLPAAPGTTAPVTVAADDRRIQYMGRIDFSNPKAPAFDWPAVNIRVAVRGAELAFLVEDPGANYYNVLVHGNTVTVVAAKAGLNRIAVPGLGRGVSLVMLTKRTEGFQGIAVFKGLELGKDTRLVNPPEAPKRKIEVIGDSWSCGYGNEGVTYGNCPNLSAVSNSEKAFPVVLANLMAAQYHVTAVSGRGILRNYGDKKPLSDDNMPNDFERLFFSKPQSKWDCSKWVPDAVVVRLGVNDYSTEPSPKEEDFVKAYAAFLERLRKGYPEAQIFCFADEGWPGYKPKILKAMELRTAAGDKRLHWVGNRSFSTSELGCDWHPAVLAHQELAELLQKNIRPVMGWNDWIPPTPTPTEAPAAIPPPGE